MVCYTLYDIARCTSLPSLELCYIAKKKFTICMAMMNKLQNLIRRNTKRFFFLPLAPIVCFPAVYRSKIGTLRSKRGDGGENVS